MAIRELRAFHLPKSLKCKLAGAGRRREACRQRPRPAWGRSTHVRRLSAPPCAPGLPPYPIRPLTWGGKESQKLRDHRDSRQQGGEAFRLLLRTLLSEGGLSSPWGPTEHGDSRGLQGGCLWQLPPVMVTTRVLETCQGVSSSQKHRNKKSTENVPHSKAGLNFCHWPSTISHLIISITSFPPEVPYSISLSSPWGKWLKLPSGFLLPDTPALLSLDLSTFPYLYLVNNKYLVANIQYLVWQGHNSGGRNGEP